MPAEFRSNCGWCHSSSSLRSRSQSHFLVPIHCTICHQELEREDGDSLVISQHRRVHCEVWRCNSSDGGSISAQDLPLSPLADTEPVASPTKFEDALLLDLRIPRSPSASIDTSDESSRDGPTTRFRSKYGRQDTSIEGQKSTKHNDVAGYLEATKLRLIDAYLHHPESPWTSQDLIIWPARTLVPGEASYRLDTFEPATTPARPPVTPERRQEINLTRQNNRAHRRRLAELESAQSTGGPRSGREVSRTSRSQSIQPVDAQGLSPRGSSLPQRRRPRSANPRCPPIQDSTSNSISGRQRGAVSPAAGTIRHEQPTAMPVTPEGSAADRDGQMLHAFSVQTSQGSSTMSRSSREIGISQQREVHSQQTEADELINPFSWDLHDQAAEHQRNEIFGATNLGMFSWQATNIGAQPTEHSEPFSGYNTHDSAEDSSRPHTSAFLHPGMAVDGSIYDQNSTNDTLPLDYPQFHNEFSSAHQQSAADFSLHGSSLDPQYGYTALGFVPQSAIERNHNFGYVFDIQSHECDNLLTSGEHPSSVDAVVGFRPSHSNGSLASTVPAQYNHGSFPGAQTDGTADITHWRERDF